ncbi:LptF/LptG family permease [Leptospira sp. GIMC2001]|uniref:LptF/LptG family permease n=1 Tax=Leptospira sp. GIMC2001 TaxID=1513297 RepID=UPI00234A3402|nr:LptF/LptG family permease [Leptospira sp. GIMC2001]WCL49088.1 LptF/LptG family permease [Leptospira sp. GIMC2001]
MEFFQTFIGTLLMLTAMILVYEITNNMKYFVENKENPIYAYLYIAFSVPNMVVQVISPSLMFSVCFVVGQFSANKELVSIMVAGVSFMRIVTPILVFGFLMWIFVAFFTQFVAIPSNKKAQDNYSYMVKGAGRLTDLVYQYHVKGKEGFYYVYWYDDKASAIKGGFNYIKVDPGGLPEYVISAQRADYSVEKHEWKLTDVEEINFTEELGVKKYEKFPEKIYIFPEAIDYFSKPTRNPDGLNFWELGEEIENRQAKGIPFRDLIVQRHAVFAMPLMSFIVVAIGALAGALTNKSAGVASLGITIAVVLLYYIFYSTGKSIGESGGIPAWVAIWYTPALFIGGAYFLYKKMNV